jgi:hypothetical protein
LFAANHVPIIDTTLFDNIQKSSIFLLYNITLESSANIRGVVRVFMIDRRLFIYIMKSKGSLWDSVLYCSPV